MLTKFKDFALTLNEEIKYHESVIETKKSIETSLWGLEEQVRFPENSSNLDQNEIIENINKCQLKIINCNKLLAAHEKKLIQFITTFNLIEDKGCSSCSSDFGV